MKRISISLIGQNGSRITFCPTDIGKIVIETVTAIKAGVKTGSHHVSCSSAGGTKIDIWYATATMFDPEWITNFEIPVEPLVYAPNNGLSGFAGARYSPL